MGDTTDVLPVSTGSLQSKTPPTKTAVTWPCRQIEEMALMFRYGVRVLERDFRGARGLYFDA